MRFPLFARILAVAALMSPAAWPTPSVTETRAPVFTADRDACYGRVYDAAHMKSHPKQKVTSLHILRSLETRRAAENWTPDARAESLRNFREEGQTSVSAFVTFRDRKGIFHTEFLALVFQLGLELFQIFFCPALQLGGSFFVEAFDAGEFLYVDQR